MRKNAPMNQARRPVRSIMQAQISEPITLPAGLRWRS